MSSHPALQHWHKEDTDGERWLTEERKNERGNNGHTAFVKSGDTSKTQTAQRSSF